MGQGLQGHTGECKGMQGRGMREMQGVGGAGAQKHNMSHVSKLNKLRATFFHSEAARSAASGNAEGTRRVIATPCGGEV